MRATKKQEYAALLAIVFIFILTRALFANSFLWFNESAWAAETDIYTDFPHATQYIPHPPLAISLYELSTHVFGSHNWSIRIVPILCSLALLLLMYWYARRHHGARVAILACALFACTFYGFLSSVQVDMDGAIVALLLMLGIVVYDRGNSKSWMGRALLIGLIAAVCSYARVITGLVLLAIIGLHELYLWYRDGGFARRFKMLLIAGTTFLAISSIAYYIIYLYEPQYVLHILTYVFARQSHINLNTLLMSVHALLLIGPALLLLPFVPWKKNVLEGIWIFIYAFLVFVLATYGDFPRYFMTAYPAICILIAQVLASVQLRARTIATIAAACALAVFALNMLAPFSPPPTPSDAISWIMHGNWNFTFFFSGSSMAPLYVSFLALVLAWAGTLVAIILWRRGRAAALGLALALLLGFNTALIVEHTFHPTTPDAAKTHADLFAAYPPLIAGERILNVDGPSYDPAQRYLGKERKQLHLLSPFNDYTHPMSIAFDAHMEQNSSAAIVSNYFGRPQSYYTTQCTLVRSFSDKGIVLSMLYSCPAQ